MRHDLLFETDRFNLSEPGPHFINPNCFGEDLAAWLRARLVERGIDAGEPDQEDWGWYLDATYRGRIYLVGVGGNADDQPGSDGSAGSPNRGEWRIILEPHRTFWERLKTVGRDGAPSAIDSEFADVIRTILEAEPGFQNIRTE
jgi:hypothetical protein